MSKRFILGLAGGAVLAGGAAALASTDRIKPGKWEFTTEMQGIPMPQLPPGMKLPPNVHFGPHSTSYTKCITDDHPVPRQHDDRCKIEHMSRTGDTVNWSVTCQTPHGTMHGVGEATYSRDSMHSTTTIDSTSARGAPVHMTNSTTGRYLGACDQP